MTGARLCNPGQLAQAERPTLRTTHFRTHQPELHDNRTSRLTTTDATTIPASSNANDNTVMSRQIPQIRRATSCPANCGHARPPTTASAPTLVENGAANWTENSSPG